MKTPGWCLRCWHSVLFSWSRQIPLFLSHDFAIWYTWWMSLPGLQSWNPNRFGILFLKSIDPRCMCQVLPTMCQCQRLRFLAVLGHFLSFRVFSKLTYLYLFVCVADTRQHSNSVWTSQIVSNFEPKGDFRCSCSAQWYSSLTVDIGWAVETDFGLLAAKGGSSVQGMRVCLKIHLKYYPHCRRTRHHLWTMKPRRSVHCCPKKHLITQHMLYQRCLVETDIRRNH